MQRFTRGQLADGLSWWDVLGLSLLAGIGFTVSLLIGELAFGTGSARNDHVKIGVLLGSLVAALLAPPWCFASATLSTGASAKQRNATPTPTAFPTSTNTAPTGLPSASLWATAPASPYDACRSREGISNMARADLTKVTTLDWAVVGAGLLAYISSFLPWYQAQVSILGIQRSVTANAWNAGIGAWLPVLLLVVAGGVVLASAMGMRLPASKPLIMIGLSALAVVTILLRWVTFPGAGGGQGQLDDVDVEGLLDVSSGAGVGLYIGLIAAAAAVVASLLASRAAGGNVS